MQFGFQTAMEIAFGRRVAARATDALAALSDRVLIVHGASPARAGWLIDALKAKGVRVATLGAPGEPSVSDVEQGAALAKEHGIGAVAGLGGGSAIDLAKAVAALAPATRPALDHLEVVGKGLPLDAAPLPFVAIPTTAGTGAEVTKNAVIGVPEHGRKVSLRDARMLPRLALVDPALTDGAPRGVTLASGLDAVTQVIEPYVSSKATPLTDALCRDAIPRGLAAIRRLAEGEDEAARDAMALTSLTGGLALANSGLGAVHGLAGPIGGQTGGAHGAICAALLPHVLELNARVVPGTHPAAAKLREVRRMIAEAFDAPEPDAFAALARWMEEAGLPRLGALGVTNAMIAPLAEAATGASSSKGNPVPLDEARFAGLIEAAL